MMTKERRVKRWTIFACTEPGCDYYRDTMSTGVHMVPDPANPTSGPLIAHRLEAVEVEPAPPQPKEAE